MWKVTVDKDKENLFEQPSEADPQVYDDDAEPSSTPPPPPTPPAPEQRKDEPSWAKNPQLKVKIEQEAGGDIYDEEKFKPEPSKYIVAEGKARGVRRKKSSRHRPPQHVARVRESREQSTHISYRRTSRARRKRRHWTFKLAVLVLFALLAFVTYEHRFSIQMLSAPLLQRIFHLGKQKIGQRAEEKSGITAISDYNETQQAPLTLADMDCHQLMPRVGRSNNVTKLELETQFAVAECYYLRGDYADSYRVLQKNEQQLQGEPLLLYTILLLKRRDFSTATKLLQSKCNPLGQNRHFFPCLAQALQRFVQSGRITFSSVPTATESRSSYSAIAWMLLALQRGEYRISSESMIKAAISGVNSNRLVALSYVYETLMRHTYRYGSKNEVAELQEVAAQNLRDEHSAASWWVRFLARIKLAETGKRELLHVISSKENLTRMYDNLDFLTIVGIESIRLGYTEALGTLLNKLWQYQRHTWSSAAKEALRFIDQWKIRINLANDHNRSVIKNMKIYANNYGQDYFYCFFRGITMMSMIGKSGKYDAPIALISRSMSRHASWENNYAYAVALLKGSKASQLIKHMTKLTNMAVTPAQKNWLFLLKAEVKISTGKYNDAITDLRNHINSYPQSFTAHRLLTAAFMRANKHKEAGVVRKAYERLQKNVPYYNTPEGMTSPIGPFAFL